MVSYECTVVGTFARWQTNSIVPVESRCMSEVEEPFPGRKFRRCTRPDGHPGNHQSYASGESHTLIWSDDQCWWESNDV